MTSSNNDRNNIDLAFNKATTMSDFMDNVAKQLDKKPIDMKATREKKRKQQKITTFSTK